MKCPYCEFDDARSQVHRHLSEIHGDQVTLRVDEERGQRFYKIVCPLCQAPYEHQVKPRSRDADFLREFDYEIKLVAFDMLLYHMQGEHLENLNSQIRTNQE